MIDSTAPSSDGQPTSSNGPDCVVTAHAACLHRDQAAPLAAHPGWRVDLCLACLLSYAMGDDCRVITGTARYASLSQREGVRVDHGRANYLVAVNARHLADLVRIFTHDSSSDALYAAEGESYEMLLALVEATEHLR